ncbi:30S ribosomal protein S16 [Haloechinothrix sp. LS1_15]|uniref:30S ribosomal protein S16 n=1 Tax=Haloechinothrix sp. LS1_15 TaxID=2652248 RepID=UPI0029456BBB|nr:30S ribosomal protein S16 [Haloechinothrix sp. LS1_15]MDV6012810.1 30S ribosomal protein S16 [Haloechinothrix sp. LS1_15]
MAVKIKLQRLGKIRAPYYRIIVADARTRRDGKAIETIGKYHPKDEPSLIEVDSERTQYWLGVGAQPTEPVQRILRITGDWQKFKGLPGAEGTLKVAEPKPSKEELFNKALAEADAQTAAADTATTEKKRGKKASKSESGKAEQGKAGDETKASDAAGDTDSGAAGEQAAAEDESSAGAGA